MASKFKAGLLMVDVLCGDHGREGGAASQYGKGGRYPLSAHFVRYSHKSLNFCLMTAEDDVPAQRDLVAGLEKGLLVIAAFDQERSRLSIAEVAERTGLTRAAARCYLITLTHLGYMRHENKLFALTPMVLRLGQSYLHSARLPSIVQPLLYRLAYALGEAASAGVLDHDQLVCVAAVSAGQLVSVTLQPGTRVPAYCTANGRVLLAHLPQAQLDEFLARAQPEQITEHTIVH